MEKVLIHKKTKNLPYILAILGILGIISFLIYNSYMHEIIKVPDVNVIVKQGNKLKLPKKIIVNLRNNSTEKVEAKWSIGTLDTNVSTEYKFNGYVQGYDKKVNLKIYVKPYIASVPEVNKIIIKGDTYSAKLPDEVTVKSSVSRLNKAYVKWNNNFDVNKLGSVTITGKIKENKNEYFINKGVEAKYNVEVITKEQAVKRLTTNNEYMDMPRSIDAVNAASKLSNTVLRKLLDDKVNISIVNSIKNQGDANIDGLFYGDSSKILVTYSNSNDYRLNVTVVLFHEIGHAFDFNKGVGGFILSTLPEFENAKKQEGEKLFNKDFTWDNVFISHTLSTSQEYFAECFALYFYNSSSQKILKDKAPLTYEYINKVVNQK